MSLVPVEIVRAEDIEVIPKADRPGAVLKLLEAIRQALHYVESPREAAVHVDGAQLAQYLAKKVEAGVDVQNQAAELVLRSRRRLGELLIEQVNHNGGRPKKNGLATEPFSLAEIGVSKWASHVAQQIASVPEAEFDST